MIASLPTPTTLEDDMALNISDTGIPYDDEDYEHILEGERMAEYRALATDLPKRPGTLR